jgi:hypothetical protein
MTIRILGFTKESRLEETDKIHEITNRVAHDMVGKSYLIFVDNTYFRF